MEGFGIKKNAVTSFVIINTFTGIYFLFHR